MTRPIPAGLLCSIALCGALGAAPALAQAPRTPQIQHGELECLPRNDNGLVQAQVAPEVGGAEVRLYFRWDDHGDFYYVVMQAAGQGGYWATPPKPADDNHQVEYYVAVVAPGGTVLGRSEPEVVPVTGDCRVVLDRVQHGTAENLVVGETADAQIGKGVLGFLCDGIISRVGPDGVLRADSICRRCIVAWWDKPQALVPAAVLLGGGTVLTEIEASPSRP